VELTDATNRGNISRHFFLDLPDLKQHENVHPILLLLHDHFQSADDMKTLFGAAASERAKQEG
jgi:hypothetical protein